MRVTREIALWVSWKLTYPRYHPRDSSGVWRSRTGTGVEGVSTELFFCPQLRGHLQLMDLPRGGGVGDSSVSQPYSLPPVSPEANKRGSATRTSSWVRVRGSPEGSFGRAGRWAGRWAGQSRTCPPTRAQPGLAPPPSLGGRAPAG